MNTTLPPNLHGVALKLSRADHHLQQLAEWVNEFLDSEFYSLDSVRTAHNRFELRIRDARSPSIKWGVVLGEIAYNLRSALDHMVYELIALASTDGVVPANLATRSAYPISSNGRRYRERGNNGRPTRSSGMAKIEGVSPAAARVIDAQQPFHRFKNPRAQALVLLQELSNVDKHRTLPVLAAQMTRSRYGVAGTGFWQLNRITAFPDPLESGNTLARFDLEVDETFDLEFEIELVPDVIFAEMPDAPAVSALPVLDVAFACRNHVVNTVFPQLANLFPGVDLPVVEDVEPLPVDDEFKSHGFRIKGPTEITP